MPNVSNFSSVMILELLSFANVDKAVYEIVQETYFKIN